MPEYLSPGVYVEEIPSAVKPIAGVSTSTAAFVGVVPPTLTMLEENPDYDPTKYDPTKPPSETNVPPTREWTFPYKEDDWVKSRDALKALTQEGSRPPRPKDGTKPEDWRNPQEPWRQKVNQSCARVTATSRARLAVSQPMDCPRMLHRNQEKRPPRDFRTSWRMRCMGFSRTAGGGAM